MPVMAGGDHENQLRWRWGYMSDAGHAYRAVYLCRCKFALRVSLLRECRSLPAYLGEGEEEGLVAGLVAQPGQSDGPAAVLEHPPVLAERHVQSVVATDQGGRLPLRL